MPRQTQRILPSWFEPIKPGARPYKIAHRGSSARAPENTALACELAVEDGAEIIELDVRLSADHHMVVIHDRLVERTTNGKGAVADLTLEQLRNLDAGYHFTTDGVTYPYRGKGIRIPTLDEILTLFPRQRFLIELKDSDFAAARELVAILQRHDAFRRVVVELISLKQRFAPWLRRLDNRMIVSHTAREIALFMALSRLGLGRLFKARGVSFEVPRRRKYGFKVVTPAFVRQAKRHGLAIFVWTVNDPDEMRKFIAMGVDGIMTDSPSTLAEILQAD